MINRLSKKSLLWVIISLALLGVLFFFVLKSSDPALIYVAPQKPNLFWPVQSIDTMKLSRDLAREKLRDPAFDAVIERQMRNAEDLGATYIAISTPYDKEFIPILRRWVASARLHQLRVWFRGNFSGWEGWFGYPKIGRGKHLELTKEFILSNPDLFKNGDVFTSCPECENGGPGDPRFTGDVDGHRKFLISERAAASDAFGKIGRSVITNYFSMNADVARLVMDTETTKALGGIVAIDHYVKSPEDLAADIDAIARGSGGKIILGEFGVPIPDINGFLSREAQAKWIRDALARLIKSKDLVGLNYWVGEGGTTEIWSSAGLKPGADELRAYYKPRFVHGFIKDEIDRPIRDANIKTAYRETVSESNGYFEIPYIENADKDISVSAHGFVDVVWPIESRGERLEITLSHINKGFWFRVLEFVHRTVSSVK